ncbi:hypothetical protein F4820DRAFT_15591 [Hypoxylon rubiginosum]|uniref:Uncharacterized protein n=1 Tax=Hypoxylon rubiginosum TaxID=110542 RepID=A0ACB9YTX8_9PEZI|nr:hypothetical protein F4820DRAFT_15591 [Hypoxylon rubiginosum]
MATRAPACQQFLTFDSLPHPLMVSSPHPLMVSSSPPPSRFAFFSLFCNFGPQPRTLTSTSTQVLALPENSSVPILVLSYSIKLRGSRHQSLLMKGSRPIMWRTPESGPFQLNGSMVRGGRKVGCGRAVVQSWQRGYQKATLYFRLHLLRIAAWHSLRRFRLLHPIGQVSSIFHLKAAFIMPSYICRWCRCCDVVSQAPDLER